MSTPICWPCHETSWLEKNDDDDGGGGDVLPASLPKVKVKLLRYHIPTQNQFSDFWPGGGLVGENPGMN
ncbi:hypothetical protein VTN77DRAFT_3914 [Rasamsonia byssochlamydoides]|uniref:uncharacterized protein n=1 Tax=Rasamsonia byssochlamydoides TaxID=89139 RepID=UPI0037424CB1